MDRAGKKFRNPRILHSRPSPVQVQVSRGQLQRGRRHWGREGIGVWFIAYYSKGFQLSSFLLLSQLSRRTRAETLATQAMWFINHSFSHHLPLEDFQGEWDFWEFSSVSKSLFPIILVRLTFPLKFLMLKHFCLKMTWTLAIPQSLLLYFFVEFQSNLTFSGTDLLTVLRCFQKTATTVECFCTRFGSKCWRGLRCDSFA